MRKPRSIDRHLRTIGALPLILLLFLTACNTGGDSTSVSPTREVATPTPEASARTASAPPTPTAIPTETVPTGSPDPERTALTALYDATDGADWKINDGWLGDGGLDKWLRVTTDENGQVTGLDLGSNQLTGEIPAELSNLSRLELLYISDNNLTGALPQSLTGISGLETFHFHNNPGLCAPIDETFQAWLRGIAEVRGSSCAPEDSLEDREVLVQLYNALDGENWNINANWLTELPIRQWYGVTNDASGRVNGLSLDGNELTGELPAALGSLSNLQRLELSNNQLSGEIPTELGSLSNLQRLELGNNKLTGEIPPELGNLGNLEILLLGSNQLTGEIPMELGSLSNLETLVIKINQLTGEIPKELSNLSNLRILVLMANQLTGEIPTVLGSMSNLVTLELNYNYLTGEIPTELVNLSNLNTLMLFGNQWSGCIPAKLSDVPKSDFHFAGMPSFC
ncbi:MAG: hypothetical protein OXD46_14005 [Chloroflexi bacterium]|nr:hypothetical protein [Chloroflexota bacterium]